MGLGQDLPADQELFPGQASFQSLNLMLIMVCVPWMLIPKPAALYWQHKQQQAHGYAALGQHDDETASYTGSGWVSYQGRVSGTTVVLGAAADAGTSPAW